ncbi:hypothetical protein [Vulcanisaeta distributa]|uniref:Uncharacterized protein n=1 Tax=Vulcanisaeta distributa (strain DSM 14429 / JCM 11212 / NBRC 100878 / IC-017) TaxID=572478 RepID=E1QUF7_VULDI|nr:hypothetical protein [Vulcanisaeta distributa]ADN49883.1 conserved hypothetical protein [Vulcanisaeta distributa DSM 14429]
MIGRPIRNYTLALLSIPYLVSPVIIYYVANYVLSLYHVPARYPLVLMGSGVMGVNYGGASALMAITITPHPIYWAALTAGLMAIPAAMEVRRVNGPGRG